MGEKKLRQRKHCKENLKKPQAVNNHNKKIHTKN